MTKKRRSKKATRRELLELLRWARSRLPLYPSPARACVVDVEDRQREVKEHETVMAQIDAVMEREGEA